MRESDLRAKCPTTRCSIVYSSSSSSSLNEDGGWWVGFILLINNRHTVLRISQKLKRILFQKFEFRFFLVWHRVLLEFGFIRMEARARFDSIHNE